MNIELKEGSVLDCKDEAIVVGMFEGTKRPEGLLKKLDTALKGKVNTLLSSGDFKGKLNELSLVRTEGLLKSPRLLLVGLGKKGEFERDALRQASATAAKALQRSGRGSVTMTPLSLGLVRLESEEVGQLLTEGISLGTYRFNKYKTVHEDGKTELKQVTILAEGPVTLKRALRRGIETGKMICDSVIRVRNLVSEPSNEVTPSRLAKEAQEIGKKEGIKVTVLERDQMKKLGMGGLLGVSKGSQEPPKFIILEYNLSKKQKPLFVFVGKGITFDSGGISIKPADKMDRMKYDMSGAAAVIGIMEAVSRLKLPIRLVGLVPTCENLPSGTSYKPGDILKALNGKTIEVLNTDAEGRLILADALSYAARYKPDGVVDLATLTGACVIALGNFAIGLLTNHERLAEKVKRAGEVSHERVWELPLWKEYTELIKSDIADVKNTGDGTAGTITAAAFLKEFVSYPWVHLDIASVAWTEKEFPYLPKGGTGVGVRLLVQLLRDWK